jgi:hypothetical protein
VDPTPERFRRLARSAPHRWRALLLEGTWASRLDPVRVLLERPDLVRVERLDGTLLHEARHGSEGGGVVRDRDGRGLPTAVLPPPELDADGLVAAPRRWREAPEVPYYSDYRFVAVLDPNELSEDVDVLDVRPVEHGGRPAWQALLRPTDEYEPRCPCCPLLFSRACDVLMDEEPRPSYADAHLVRLDVGTGVCVRTREVGGPYAGQGHELVVLDSTL